MSTTVDQQIDQKIHRFLARKSPLKTFSKTVAERLLPAQFKNRRPGISYEPLRWHHG